MTLKNAYKDYHDEYRNPFSLRHFQQIWKERCPDMKASERTTFTECKECSVLKQLKLNKLTKEQMERVSKRTVVSLKPLKVKSGVVRLQQSLITKTLRRRKNTLFTKIGEMSYTTTPKERRDLQLGYEGRTARLTLWGEIAKSPNASVGEVFNIVCIRPANDFAGQRCYNSTPSTVFEPVTFEDEEVGVFEGLVESVSFESNFIEVEDTLLSITPEVVTSVFAEKKFEANTELQSKKTESRIN
uniref:Uncharacterized protein n=1 Tax=Magallana gigas TaxID=29159 RepID=K1QWN1_MAGGI